MARVTLVKLPALTAWRIRQGLSQHDLAKAASMSRFNVGRIERGGETHPKRALKLARALHCSIDDLMAGHSAS